MIERKIISRKLKEYVIGDYIQKNLKRVGYSGTKIQKTPLGEKVIISASRPGLIVGRKGGNIKKLTADLKRKFNLENPQIEINEIQELNLDANIVAERIASYLERFGSSRFKNIGHKVIGEVMSTGALGIEILISGKIPGARAKRWRFYKGYLKKCGDMAVSGIKKAIATAHLKSGAVGIQVRIMPIELKEKNDIELLKIEEEVVEEIEIKEPKKEDVKEKSKTTDKKEKKNNKDKTKPTKKVAKKEDEKEDKKKNKKEDIKEKSKTTDKKEDKEKNEEDNKEKIKNKKPIKKDIKTKKTNKKK
ncbi:30S ribosomal protein S3 [Candidatus Woesearchaeota archaeon]|nr:30S ribosomal protein S3 [Candidatus Woesearchaeota archaeon]